MKLLAHLAVALVLIASAVLAEDTASVWLPGDDIAEVLSGKTLDGRYANGRAFTERYLAGGRLEYSEDGETMGGHWSVTAGTLCTIYDTESTGGCYRISKSGQNCFEFYFTTRTEAAAPGPEGSIPTWTARGAVEGEPATCHDGANV